MTTFRCPHCNMVSEATPIPPNGINLKIRDNEEISVRTRNVCYHAGIVTIEDLLKRKRREFLHIRGAGEMAARELADFVFENTGMVWE